MMPNISAFYGISIRIYFADHPPPHFHAIYGDDAVQIQIRSGNIIEGALPRRALGLVEEWRKLHIHELMDDWELAQAHKALNKIEPLE